MMPLDVQGNAILDTDLLVHRKCTCNYDTQAEFDIQYSNIQAAFDEVELYEPISVLDYEPKDCYDRRHWYEKLSTSMSLMMYVYPHGNYLGNIVFVWKVPDVQHDVDESQNARCISNLNSNIGIYATRQMHKDFIDKYGPLVKAGECFTSHVP